ncbi:MULTISPECIES: bifunctional protein-serine/threonine kinase/phosphatase [Ramlibacter]|uniref:Protein kinase n=1 Tax=Ramlibacter pinisoli TaxID=2682844 RepID=A0A6N8IPD2_9BURK|nr:MULTISPECIES: bifunctional protein-serine/threonine kinase/phosphatase [Ramlibacter]MBA2963627.1 bifunctional protein-serine/threonine kinase/phosphatase [Ramlibacter sp. CGMCC 1.13660]MVQ28592.1 protein kinase [Ramlibacter pinisoli]
MALQVDIGWHSARGGREHNEDFAAALRPQPHEAARGLIAAIADGVSAGGGGREAAQTSVMALLQDWFGTPATWETSAALDRLIGAQNAWLAATNRRRGAGAMTTLTALVLRGQSWTLAHVGDTRAWLLREGRCTQLTTDHVFDHPDMASRLTRALGLEDHVRVDYLQGELQRGDVFVLTSDGVHRPLGGALARELQRAAGGAQATSEVLVEAALRAGSRDNASALVIRVQDLAAVRLEDVLVAGHLPAPARLKVGDTLDAYTVTALVADTGVHRLYQAREAGTRELVTLKVLHEARAGDPEERAMLAHEIWLGLRLAEQVGAGRSGFVRVRQPREPSAFYAVFDWHGGQTLEQALSRRQPFTVEEVVRSTIEVARALGRLHRQDVVHRDIKPGNLHRGDDGHWRVLDLGVAVSGFESEARRDLHAGTPSYMNPEQWEEGAGPATAQGDLFALGVTLYQWLTGHLPYGEIEPYQRARYRRDPRPPSRLRPDVPVWLDHVVLRAVARDPRQRFETAEELVLALERGASRPVAAPGPTPYFTRDPAGVWKAALVASVALNALLLVWLLFLPR